jgi:hypothetical protein
MPRLNVPSAQPAFYLRQKDAAAFLSCSVAYLQKLHKSGAGPDRVLLNGSLLVYPVDALHRWAQQQQVSR